MTRLAIRNEEKCIGRICHDQRFRQSIPRQWCPTAAISRLVVLAIGLVLICAAPATSAGELHDAVRAHDKAAVEASLAGGAEVDDTDFSFGTALHVAVSQGTTEIAQILIDLGANVEAVSEQQGARSMHLAAQFGDTPMLALLLDNRAYIEARDEDERTPLHRAAAEGHPDAVRLLLDRGAEVDSREGRYGWTPLHESAYQGRLDVVKLLLDHGADIRAIANTGESAFALAATSMSYEVVGSAELLAYLAARGADIHLNDNSGLSVLEHAEHRAIMGILVYDEIAEALRNLGAPQ